MKTTLPFITDGNDNGSARLTQGKDKNPYISERQTRTICYAERTIGDAHGVRAQKEAASTLQKGEAAACLLVAPSLLSFGAVLYSVRLGGKK